MRPESEGEAAGLGVQTEEDTWRAKAVSPLENPEEPVPLMKSEGHPFCSVQAFNRMKQDPPSFCRATCFTQSLLTYMCISFTEISRIMFD